MNRKQDLADIIAKLSEEQTGRSEGGVRALELFIVLAKHKRLVLLLPLVMGLLGLGACFLLPKTFQSTARLMPPQQSQSMANSMLGQLGALAGAGSISLHNPSDIYISMLKGRRIADRLIQRFSLQRVYRLSQLDEVRKRLAGATELDAQKDGVVVIMVSDRNAARAAQLANGYASELQELTKTFVVTEASHRRLFFEQAAQSADTALAAAEEQLKKTQETTGVLELEGQSKAVIESLTAGRAHLAEKEAEIASMRAYATPENPAFIRAQQEAAAMRDQLNKLDAGQAETSILRMGARRAPDAALKYLRALREVKYRSSLLELLEKQYEAARIDEAKEAPLIQVLDEAYPADKQTSPRPIRLVTGFGVAGFILAFLLALFLEAVNGMQLDSTARSQLASLKFYLALRSQETASGEYERPEAHTGFHGK